MVLFSYINFLIILFNGENMKKVISFPHMADYYIPIKYFLEHVINCDILLAPPITNKTIELGSKYSPDFVCTPFKYTLGSFIESLDMGANIIIQFGGGCRYGYYSELQEQVLKDLGYDFKMINLITAGKTDIKKIIKELKIIDCKFSKIKGIYYLLITKKMVEYMDIIDDYIRKNIGFEVDKGSFINLKNEMLEEFSNVKGYFYLKKIYKKYIKKFKMIKINKPKDCLKVGIIGELYTVMEPFANYNIEYELAKKGVEIIRFTNVTYLLFKKKKAVKKYLKENKLVKYRMGADATDNIYFAKWMSDNNFDGIIHIKSSFCTPEISSMGIINKICKEYDVPVNFYSFDANTSEVGIKTRLEAFYDVLEMRRNHD